MIMECRKRTWSTRKTHDIRQNPLIIIEGRLIFYKILCMEFFGKSTISAVWCFKENSKEILIIYKRYIIFFKINCFGSTKFER